MSSGFKRRLILCKIKYEIRQKTDETVGAIDGIKTPSQMSPTHCIQKTTSYHLKNC